MRTALKINFILWLIIVLIIKLSTVAFAQSNRNPCVYITQPNCLAVGYYLAGISGAPMPVGGIANASAPTFTEAKPGYLSFDLSGNLRVVTSGGGTVNGNISNATSGVATTSTNVGTVSYNYGWNGTTWDQLSSLTVGSKNSLTTAIVDASGNQITTFGTAWANTNKVIAWDGTTNTTVKAASTAPVATDTSLVTALNPNSPGIIALGQATKANSVPTVIASDQLGPAADTAALPIITTPTSNSASGITPVVGGSAVSSLVLKNAAGNLYSVYANCTAACWLMVFNATSAPSNGATTAGNAASNMVECVPIGAGSIGGINYSVGPPAIYSTGITATISSTACATLTLSTVGFIHGMVK